MIEHVIDGSNNLKQVIEIPRQLDGEGLYLHFSGGFRAANVAKGEWRIEPVCVNGRPCATGPLTTQQLKEIARRSNFQVIAFHRFGWIDGVYYSSWTPIIPGRNNHFEGPADLWSNIARNIGQLRTKEFFDAVKNPTEEEVAKALDDQDPVEALARYISVSLRSMDISVEYIAEHYHVQLVNHMSAGRVNGERSANTLSQTLYAHVHSFFLHVGAVRDYFGALVAFRIGLDPTKTDSVARLVSELRQANLPNDALLDLLFSSGNVAAHPQKRGKLAVAGWMQEVTAIRNGLIHRRPYGARFSERSGWAIPAHKEAGIFRYYRPLELEGVTANDVLEFICLHYAQCAHLLHKAARASGNDTAMTHITDKDVVSFEMRKPREPDSDPI